MTARRYAQDTTVSVSKSRSEIEDLLTRYGATSFMTGTQPQHAIIAFEMQKRKVVFYLPLPDRADRQFTRSAARGKTRTAEAAHAAWEQACRSRWRALALAIKAKLEAVAVGITTFEDEFLAHIQMPDGVSVAHHVRPRIAAAYESGTMTPLLPAPTVSK